MKCIGRKALGVEGFGIRVPSSEFRVAGFGMHGDVLVVVVKNIFEIL